MRLMFPPLLGRKFCIPVFGDHFQFPAAKWGPNGRIGRRLRILEAFSTMPGKLPRGTLLDRRPHVPRSKRCFPGRSTSGRCMRDARRILRYVFLRARSPAAMNAGLDAGVDLTHKERAAHVCKEFSRALEQRPGTVRLFEDEQGVAVL